MYVPLTGEVTLFFIYILFLFDKWYKVLCYSLSYGLMTPTAQQSSLSPLIYCCNSNLYCVNYTFIGQRGVYRVYSAEGTRRDWYCGAAGSLHGVVIKSLKLGAWSLHPQKVLNQPLYIENVAYLTWGDCVILWEPLGSNVATNGSNNDRKPFDAHWHHCLYLRYQSCFFRWFQNDIVK